MSNPRLPPYMGSWEQLIAALLHIPFSWQWARSSPRRSPQHSRPGLPGSHDVRSWHS
jgi:hypothetical protein